MLISAPDHFKGYKALAFVIVFDMIITFSDWIKDNYVTLSSAKNNIAVCPPYFQSCLDYYFLDSTPYGYGQNILYMFLGTILFASLYFLYTEDYKKFAYFMSIPLLFKFMMLYIFTYLNTGNYNLLGLSMAMVLLYSKRKLYYLRILLIVFYLSAASIKLDKGYLTGGIFDSLQLGVPLFPHYMNSFLGILFLILCLISPILLFNKAKRIRVTYLVLLTLFHMYSIAVVGFRFPSLVIPTLWVIYFFEKDEFNYNIKTFFMEFIGPTVIIFTIILQSIPFIIKGDHVLTGEGYKFGYYMFLANYQCVSTVTTHNSNEEYKTYVSSSTKALYMCDPYIDYFRIKRSCDPGKVKNIEWTFDKSINGSPYMRIINIKNACKLEYSAFSHNDWIELTPKILEITPEKNSI